MKALMMMMTILSIGFSVVAAPDFGRGGRDDRGGIGRDHGRGGDFGRGRLICKASDNGWEEHWGGHNDCRSCLAAHGNCTERCSREEFRCEVEGRRFGRVQTYFGRADSRWEAEEQALRDCRRDRSERCTVKRCTTNSQVVSQRSCR